MRVDSRYPWILLVLLSLAAAGYGYRRGQVHQTAVLTAITSMAERVTRNNEVARLAARQMVGGICRAVNANRFQPRDVAVLEAAQHIQARTTSLVDTLHTLQTLLLPDASRATSGKLPQRPVDSPELAFKNWLPAALDRYTGYISQYVPGSASLTQPARGLFRTESFTQLYQKGVPPLAALAVLTRLEAQLRRYEAEALANQAMRVGTSCGFTKTGPLAVATANVVAPGAMYEAQLFITEASGSGNMTQMWADGKPLPRTSGSLGGQGVVEFRVPPARPGQPDTTKTVWHGTIRAMSCLADTTWHLSVPYFIVKPAKP